MSFICSFYTLRKFSGFPINSNKIIHFGVFCLFLKLPSTCRSSNTANIKTRKLTGGELRTAKFCRKFFQDIDGGGDTKFILIEMSSSFGSFLDSISLNRTRPLRCQMIHRSFSPMSRPLLWPTVCCFS